LTVEHCDGRDRDSVKIIVDKVRADFVINCIGDTYVPTAYREPQRFFDINLGCHLNLLLAVDAARLRRMIYVSSTEVYGSVDAYSTSEEERLAPVNTYAVSKTAADRLSYTFCLEHGLPVVVARIFNCYGPRETHPYVIPEIISQFARGTTVRLGNLDARRDCTYVHDTARALIALLTCAAKNGVAVNVGSGVAYSVEWLARTIAREMEIERPEIVSDPARLRKYDIDCFRCDNAVLQRLTGWSPEVDIIEGLRRTIRWYMAEGCRWPWEERSNDVSFSTDPAIV
jgi:nucleoside-diphosphate-sugar epimerase